MAVCSVPAVPKAAPCFLSVGKVESVKISRAGLRHALHAHENPLLIHHMKHHLDAFSFGAQKFGNAIPVVAKVQHRRGRTFHAHLVLDPRTVDVIEFARRAVCGHPDLRQDKTGESFGSFGITLDPRQQNVNDVLSQVLFPSGNEDFSARNGIGAIRIFQTALVLTAPTSEPAWASVRSMTPAYRPS